MPPAKNRHHDDSKSEATAKEKHGGHSATKIRRVASQQGGSNLREVQNASASAKAQPPAEATAPSLQWSSFERDALHAYRRQYRLNTPSAFTCTFHQTVLSQPSGIGMYSPTMLRRKKGRQNKERLTMAVRKHFNDLGIQENDVIVDFICKLKNQEAAQDDGPKRQTIPITE